MHTLSDVCNFPRHEEQLFGVEVEVESDYDIQNDLPYKWVRRDDHSLRSRFPVEFISDAMNLDQCLEAVLSLERYLSDNNIDCDTVRAGVHIHMDVGGLTRKELAKFLILYFTAEPLLMSYCGNGRKGNHFCLSLQDTPAYVFNLIKFVESVDRTMLENYESDVFKYSAMNVTGMGRHGTVEFRGLRTPRTDNLYKVVRGFLLVFDMLLKQAREIESMRRYLSDWSIDGGYQSMYNKITNLLVPHSPDHIPCSFYDIRKDMSRNLRLAQGLVRIADK